MTRITIERETLARTICTLNAYELETGVCSKVAAELRAALAPPNSGMVMLMMYRGDLCYKSRHDDQSYGMWCPVLWEGIPEGTEFFTAYKEITS